MKTRKYDWSSIMPKLTELRYSGMKIADCCTALGINEKSLRYWLAAEGLKMPPTGPDVPPPSRKPSKPSQCANVWPPHHTKTLIEIWPFSSPKDIGATIGRTQSAVIAKAHALGLSRGVKVRTERKCLCGCGEIFVSALPPAINRINPDHTGRIS